MVCFYCEKKIENLNFYSLRNDDKIINFCCVDCLKKYMEIDEEDLKGLTLYKIRRCVGYHDCRRLDNIRGICEDKEEVFKEKGLIDLTALKPPQCNPGNVAIIKSSIKMLDLFEKFDETSTKISSEMLDHTKSMKYLTKWILVVTIANFFFVIISIVLTIQN